MPTHSGPSAPIVNQPNSHWSGSQVAVKWYSNGSQWNSKNNQTKFSTGLFWTCILEQPRVEFDTPLFQYTGPEQPRVNWMTLERRQVDFNWMLSACGVDVEWMWWNSKNNQTKLSTVLFWTCILEQPRVEFDTPLFQYTGPEQPRVNWMTSEW